MMKSIFNKQPFALLLLIGPILLGVGCNVNTDKSKLPKTTLRVIDSIKHYYPIRHKKELNIQYKIVNTGQNPLAIYDVEASCGCTIPEFPKGPIQAGKEGIFMIKFISEGLFGYNKHYVTFEANTPPFSHHTLIFDVVVVPDEFGYGDGFDYRYESGQNSKSALEEAVDGDETQQGYYTDSTSFKENVEQSKPEGN